MISVQTFLNGVKQNAARVKAYQKGRDGSGGKCDCVGLIIGALRLCGVAYNGTHGSNYFARYYTLHLHRVASAADLKPGELVYKAHDPGEKGYDARNSREKYGKSGDDRDYYHIGVVKSVKPLVIAHCSGGGMHYDSTLGKWEYAGECKGVDYMANEPEAALAVGESAVVDTPNDGTLNVRQTGAPSGKILVRIPDGQSVTITEIKGEWARVAFPVGWVQTKFLKGGKNNG